MGPLEWAGMPPGGGISLEQCVTLIRINHNLFVYTQVQEVFIIICILTIMRATTFLQMNVQRLDILVYYLRESAFSKNLPNKT